MNFELTEDQKMIQEMVRSFAEKEIKPVAKSLEENHEFPGKLLKELADLGILGMAVPAEFGGTKIDNLALMLAIEEISRILPSLSVILSVHCSLFCTSILKYGNEEQKNRYLPKAAAGDILGAFSLTEPGAGSDATKVQTKAVRQGDEYILNGTKNWVSTGSKAGAIITIAATDSSSRGKKLSAFILDAGTPGFSVSKIEEKMGLHSSLTAEVYLKDCRIPAANLLGEEGQGAKIAFAGLDCSRIGIAAQSVGIAQRAMEEAIAYSLQREAFGGKIAELQAIQFKLADIALLTDTARLLTLRAANLYDLGKSFGKEAAMAKLFASEAANKIAYEALQIHGGYGYSKEFPVEQIYRDARVLSIYEGTSEIQRMLIARHLLKE